MLRKLFLVGLMFAGLAGVASPALAVPRTYYLAIDGEAHYICHNLCTPADIDEVFPWAGNVSLTAPSELDGTFTAIAFNVAVPVSFFFSSDDLGAFFTSGGGGGFGPPRFTVLDGLVTDVELSAFGPIGNLSLTGMTAMGFESEVVTDAWLSQTEVGVITNVPEPQTYALLLSGLAAVIAAVRRRRT